MQAADVLDEACEDEVSFGEEWERKILNVYWLSFL